MVRGRGWMAVLGMVVCTALISAAALAHEGEHGDKCGGGHKNAGRHRAKRQKMRGMGSETLRKEFEKFQANRKAFKAEADAFREKVKKAVQAAHQGEGKPTREMVEEAVAQYKDEAKAIATKMIGERIRHHEAIVSILKAEKSKMIDRLTKGLLTPHGGPGGRKNLRRKGQGKGSEGRRREGRRHDVQIDVPE